MRHGYTFLNVSWTLLDGLTIKSSKIKCTATAKEEAAENEEVELWELQRNRNRSWEGKRKRGAGKKVPSPSPCSLVDSNALLPSQGKMRLHGRSMGRGWVPRLMV